VRQWVRSHLTYANVMVTILAFIVLGGMGYAATGGNLILGKSNSASSKTALSAPVSDKALQLTNTSTAAGATALGLNVASSHAPFTVNSGTQVKHLNADKLDGLDSSAFYSSANVKPLSFSASSCTNASDPGCSTNFSLGNLSLHVSCFMNAATDPELEISNTSPTYAASAEYVKSNNSAVYSAVPPSNPGLVDLAEVGNTEVQGSIITEAINGAKPVTANFFANKFGAPANCNVWILAVKAS
jgi:hypothetical protein